MNRSSKLLLAGCVALIGVGCATTPRANSEVEAARANLTALQADPTLAPRAPVAIKEAEQAVVSAEAAQSNGDQNVGQMAYVANRKVEIARAQAQQRLAEDQVSVLADKRDQARLTARTHEAEAARTEAQNQQQIAAAAMSVAEQERANASASKQQADMAMMEAEDYRKQLSELQAKQTDRGMVMTLGDVLFSTGKSDLKPGAQERLDKLAAFMGKFPNRSIVIEGHTDSVGNDSYNLALSQRRADSVKAYLTNRGVAAARVNAVGRGEATPIAGNTNEAGRQQNRRVEIVIQNPATG